MALTTGRLIELVDGHLSDHPDALVWRAEGVGPFHRQGDGVDLARGVEQFILPHGDLDRVLTPARISSSSKTTLWGNPALFLNSIFSPAETENLLGSKTSPLLPSSAVMADEFPAKRAAEAAVTMAVAPTTSLSDARTTSLGAAVKGKGILAATAAGFDAGLRPVNDGIATAAKLTVASSGQGISSEGGVGA